VGQSNPQHGDSSRVDDCSAGRLGASEGGGGEETGQKREGCLRHRSELHRALP
jgi:hypothetical protein